MHFFCFRYCCRVTDTIFHTWRVFARSPPSLHVSHTPLDETLLPGRRCDVGLHRGTHATTGHYTALCATGITNLQKSFIIIIGLETRCILQHDHLSNFSLRFLFRLFQQRFIRHIFERSAAWVVVSGLVRRFIFILVPFAVSIIVWRVISFAFVGFCL